MTNNAGGEITEDETADLYDEQKTELKIAQGLKPSSHSAAPFPTPPPSLFLSETAASRAPNIPNVAVLDSPTLAGENAAQSNDVSSMGVRGVAIVAPGIASLSARQRFGLSAAAEPFRPSSSARYTSWFGNATGSVRAEECEGASPLPLSPTRAVYDMRAAPKTTAPDDGRAGEFKPYDAGMANEEEGVRGQPQNMPNPTAGMVAVFSDETKEGVRTAGAGPAVLACSEGEGESCL